MTADRDILGLQLTDANRRIESLKEELAQAKKYIGTLESRLRVEKNRTRDANARADQFDNRWQVFMKQRDALQSELDALRGNKQQPAESEPPGEPLIDGKTFDEWLAAIDGCSPIGSWPTKQDQETIKEQIQAEIARLRSQLTEVNERADRAEAKLNEYMANDANFHWICKLEQANERAEKVEADLRDWLSGKDIEPRKTVADSVQQDYLNIINKDIKTRDEKERLSGYLRMLYREPQVLRNRFIQLEDKYFEKRDRLEEVEAELACYQTMMSRIRRLSR